MSTLIAVYSGTQCIGRCDAHCYDAKHPQCDCICGGKNHGVGQKKAEQQTRDYCDQWVERYITEKNLPGAVGSVNPDLFQMKLF